MSDEAPVQHDIAAILARLEALEAENAALKARQPQFKPMARPERPRQGGYLPPEELRKQAMKSLTRDGQMASRQSSAWDDPAKWADVPEQFRPAFTIGTIVRLNPESKVHGGEKTWGEVSIPNGGVATEIEGEVLATMGRARSWEPKYKVRFPGLTRTQGDGFYESELIFA